MPGDDDEAPLGDAATTPRSGGATAGRATPRDTRADGASPDDDAPRTPLPSPLEYEPVEPEEAVLIAMGAYDNFARGIVMSNRGILTKSQVDVMLGLILFGKMNMTQVSEHLAASKEQASRAVAPLVERGLVKRTRSVQNHRVIEITLTEEGLRQFELSRSYLIEGIRNRLAHLSEKDRAALMDASRTADRILRKLRQR